jgi:hypothetical protein
MPLNLHEKEGLSGQSIRVTGDRGNIRSVHVKRQETEGTGELYL